MRGEYRDALRDLLARPDDPQPLADYLASNSRLPGPRGNLELAADFARAMTRSLTRSAWRPVMIGWASLPADVVPTNDPREFLPFCGLLALGVDYPTADVATRSETASLLRAAAGNPRWRTREGVAMAMQLIGEADLTALRELVETWMARGPNPMEQRAIVAALAHPPILVDRPTVMLSLDVSRRILAGVRSLDRQSRRTEEFRVLSKGLEYAISVFVAAAPVEGFALLRDLAATDDRDVRRIVRSNLGKSRLAARHAAEVAAILESIEV